MAKTICAELLDILSEVCVTKIFGVTGDALNPFVDAIRRDGRFEWLTVKHEEAGAFAAAAQAKLTGKLAVCCGTVGPGALHLLNGLYDAKREYAPVLAVTGQVPESEYGTSYFQEVNLEAVFDDACVFNQTVRSVDQFQRLAQQAVQAALDHQGVAHLSIPVDIIGQKLPDDRHKRPIFRMLKDVTPTDEALAAAADVLNRSEKTAILVGDGCRGASDELLDVAEKLQAPIAHSLRGSDVVDYMNPYWIGGIGHLGTPQGLWALEQCDALLMVGTDFPYRAFLPSGIDIVQIDIRRQNIGRRCAVTHPLVGHAKPTLQLLATHLKRKQANGFLASIQQKRENWDNRMNRKADPERSSDVIHPQAVVRAFSDLADEDAVFVADVGTATVWTARHLRFRGQQRLLGSFNHGSLGVGLPAAMGAQSVDRNRQVIAVCGDGGFGMLMADFITAVRYKLPIKILVLNNQKLSFVELEMQASGYPQYATDIANPDFAEFSRICGGQGVRIDHPSEIRTAVAQALKSKVPFLIDAIVHPDELVLPPRIEPAAAWGFTMGKIRQLWHELDSKEA